jgi:HAMP domain-containing protein
VQIVAPDLRGHCSMKRAALPTTCQGSCRLGRDISKTKIATDRSDEAIDFGSFVMLMIAGVSVAGAALFVWFYIGRNLVARLVGLEKTMTRLATGGDLSADVGARRGGDEIGQMADAFSVFREGIVKANAAAEKAREREAKQRQAAAIDRLTREFNDGAARALVAVCPRRRLA